MITHIEIEGFKSFQKVSLDLGALNIFVGTNASGKSNFFDALRVLQGIGYGYTIDEIFNGKPKSAKSEVWDPIRGGSANAGFLRGNQGGGGKLVRDIVKLKVRIESPEVSEPLTYAVSIASRGGVLRRESLLLGEAKIFETTHTTRSPTISVDYYGEGRPSNERFEKTRPVLHQLLNYRRASEQHRDLIETCTRLLGNAQFLNPAPSILRDYSAAPVVKRIGERGEGFAALVKSIMADEDVGDAYLSWLKELTPVEIDTVIILQGAIQDSLFAIKRRGLTFPAPVLSDGTLRFSAIAAAFFQADMPETLLIEEIENGIHPTRLRLLVELLKSESENGRPQVMATSHSPLVLAWLDENDYKTVFLCQTDEKTGASTITPFASIPGLIELAREQSVADLFAEGWMETAL